MKESIKIQSIKEEFGNFSKIRDFIKTAYQINDFNSKTSAHSYIGGKDTLILTKRGLVKIKDINIRDKVWNLI